MEYLKTYQFGSLSEITQAFEEFEGMSQLTNEQIMQMKLAMAETMQDIGLVGPEAEERQVMASQVGAAQAINDVSQ